MWYRIDINKLAYLILPPTLRKTKMFAFAKVLVYPFVCLVDRLNNYQKKANELLSVNGQVIYIEKALNDYFLLPEKDIYITEVNIDNLMKDVYLMDGEDGSSDTYAYDADSNNVTYLPDSVQNDSLYYVVMIPAYLKSQEQDIINVIEYNKPAGRIYKIQYYEY